MDRPCFGRIDRAFFVHGFAHDVQNTAKRGVSDGNGNRAAGVGDGLTADQTLGRVHRDGTYRVLTQVLGHFQHEAVAMVVRFQRVQNLGQVILELNVDDRADDLRYFSDCFCHVVSPVCSTALPRRK